MTDEAIPEAVSGDLWAVARDAYLSGATATSICREFAIAPSTFWSRAAREGWLRRDHPRRAPPPQPVDLSAPADDPAIAIDKAWRRICAALDVGDAAAAARWTRVHAQLSATATAGARAVAADQRRAEHQRSMDDLRASQSLAQAAGAQLALLRARERTARGENGTLEKVESVSPDSSPPPPDRPLNRAERRRLRRRGDP